MLKTNFGSLPTTASEISLEAACNFLIALQKKIAFEQSYQGNALSDRFQLKNIFYIENCIKECLGRDFISPRGLPIGDFRKYWLKYTNTNALKELDFDKCENDLLSVFIHLYKCILSYQPALTFEDNYTFEHKEEHFTIPKVYRDALQQTQFDKVTVEQYVRILQLRKTQQENEDKDGSLMYTRLVQQVALLAMREWEELPTNEEGLDDWLTERTTFFADIDFKTALDVDFFLHSTMGICEILDAFIGFSTPLNPKAKKNLKPWTKPDNEARKLGQKLEPHLSNNAS